MFSPHVFFPFHRVQSAQQFHALQAQYSGFNSNHQFQYPEIPDSGEAAMAHMAHPDAMMHQQEPADLTKRIAILIFLFVLKCWPLAENNNKLFTYATSVFTPFKQQF